MCERESPRIHPEKTDGQIQRQEDRRNDGKNVDHLVHLLVRLGAVVVIEVIELRERVRRRAHQALHVLVKVHEGVDGESLSLLVTVDEEIERLGAAYHDPLYTEDIALVIDPFADKIASEIGGI